MTTVVKRAISLPKKQDRQIQELAKAKHAPYSAIIRAAIQVFLEAGERKRMEIEYQRYYSDKTQAKKEREIVQEFWSLSQKAWP